MSEFSEFGLKAELLEALKRIGFTAPTEVQGKAIPVILTGKDAIVRAKTGTGKTGAFTVPIMQMLSHHQRAPEALVIVPTRELALQVATFTERLGSPMRVRTATVYGGASINVQVDRLARGVNIVVGTPGRIIDLVKRGALDLTKIRFLVLDEADIMLDMGFVDDIDYIISNVPDDKQMTLFSATMPREIREIARKHMRQDHASIIVGEEEDLTVSTIKHSYTYASGKQKFASLMAYIGQVKPRKAIIFASTQREADIIHRFLAGQHLNAAVLHGGLTQAMRERSLGHFKGQGQYLIATNIASRGLDIASVSDVINFDAPDDPHVYVHRVGRSARMGAEGRAFTIFNYDQRDLYAATERVANVTMSKLNLDLTPYKDIEIPLRRGRGMRGPQHGMRGGRPGFGRPREGGGFRRPHRGGYSGSSHGGRYSGSGGEGHSGRYGGGHFRRRGRGYSGSGGA